MLGESSCLGGTGLHGTRHLPSGQMMRWRVAEGRGGRQLRRSRHVAHVVASHRRRVCVGLGWVGVVGCEYVVRAISLLPDEDPSWWWEANVGRNDQPGCVECIRVWRRAHRNVPFEEHCDRVRQDAVFRNTVAAEAKILRGDDKSFNDETVSRVSRSGVTVGRHFVGMTDKDVQDKFGVSARDLKLPMHTIFDSKKGLKGHQSLL